MEGHPTEKHIQHYLDNELDANSRRAVAEHLVACASCRNKLRAHQALRARIRQSLPRASDFRSEGEFWGMLVARLPTRPQPVWSFVPYLPPILLSIPSALLPPLVSVILALYTLMRMGLLPSVGSLFTARLIPLLGQPFLEKSLYSLWGWTGEEVTGYVLKSWASLGIAVQDMFVVATVLILLVGLCFVVAVLYFGWVACWSGTSPSYIKRR